MRLISALRKAEAARDRALRRGSGAPRAAGIVWGQHEVRVDPRQLEPGEHVAVDIDVSIAIPGWTSPDSGEWIAPQCAWRIRERIASDPVDLGIVTAGGRAIGAVVGLHGSKVEIVYAAGCDPSLRPPPDAGAAS